MNGGSTGTDTSVDQLIDLALLQGNRYIKELLRSKGPPLGTNKQQFEEHLRAATGRLPVADVREWLGGVEGWGNQHVYAFDVPAGAEEGVRDRETFRGM